VDDRLHFPHSACAAPGVLLQRTKNGGENWGYIVIPIGAFLVFAMFDHFGKLPLARPTVFSVSMIVIAVAMRWKLNGQVWFWITMASLAALHLPLILFIPWTAKWIPVLIIIPIGIADLYAMLWVVSVVGKFMGGSITAYSEHNSRSTRTRKLP
jgi:hypothetical protein